MNTKITLPQIVESLANLTGSSTTITETFIRELFALITDALISKETVRIKNLGIFSRSESQPDSVIFIPDESIAEAINSPFVFFEAVELNDDVTEDILCEASTSPADETIQDSPTIIYHEESTDTDSNDCISHIKSEDEIKKDDSNDSDAQILTSRQEVESEIKIEIETSKESMHIENTNDDDTECNAVNSSAQSRINTGWLFGFIIGVFVGVIVTLFIIDCNKSKTATIPEQNIIEIDSIQKVDSIIENHISEIDTTVITEIYDTIRPNRYLTTMARQYYGEMNFWVYIYEENKDHLKHPDKISPGTRIRIPDINKYDIDAKNPISIEKAKLKAIEIYSQYQ